MRTVRWLPAAGFAAVLACVHPSAAAATESTPPDERPSGGARLTWVLDGELELLGDTWVDLPVEIGERDSLFLGVDARTAISRSTSDLTFEVRDLQYDLDLGWRRRCSRFGQRYLVLLAGQRGLERVDADGQAFVQYLALGAESAEFRRFPGGHRSSGEHRFDWRIVGGPVFKEREVEAQAVLRGAARLRLARGPWRSSFGFDLNLDGLIGDGRWQTDVAAGPRLSIPAPGDRWASFFLHYQRSRNPLGLDEDVWLLGFSYEEGIGGGAWSGRAPEVDGLIAAGGGEGRVSGELLLRLLSPDFLGEHHVVFQLDSNILTADDTGELYYLYHLGLERPVTERTRAGLYFYHRSNHQLAEPNDEVTSLNVLEIGVENNRWRLAPRVCDRVSFCSRPLIEAGLRIGYLINSSFGEDRRWHARGGLRLSVPFGEERISPYLQAELETGDVERESYAIGITLRGELSVQLEHRDDEQFFGRDQTAMLLTTRYGF